MLKYKAIRVSNNQVISEWTSDFADENYYEENWGKPEHQVVVTEAVYDEETSEILEEAVYETIPAEYTIEIEDVTAQVDQERINAEAQAFLDESDYRVLRHYGQVSLGIELSLTEEEYLILENQRQEARKRIVR